MYDILPGINETTEDTLLHKVALTVPHTKWIHVDIADGTLAQTHTVTDQSIFARIAKMNPDISFEAHLMVSQPEKYIKPLADAGFHRLIAHVESNDPRHFLDQAAYESLEVGLAIDGPTEFEQIEPFLDAIDYVLVMTVEIGPSGQAFLPETVEKVRLIREHLPDLPIEVDGGIDDKTVKIATDAGATRVVATSYIYRDVKRIAQALAHLKGE